jgi:hypothetical protein
VHAAALGALVPVEPEPAQIAQDGRLRFARRALGIGVFDAQDERAGGAARQQPVEQRGSGVPDVQMAGGAGGDELSLNLDYTARINTTAWAAMASPRPMASTPSLVPLDADLRGVDADRRRDGRAHRVDMVLDLRLLGTTVTSRLPDLEPLPGDERDSAPSRSRLEASFHRGSVSGKCLPMSPRQAAPRIASVAAWQTTSASEWPSAPVGEGIVTPPRTSGRPPTSRCRS